MPPPRGGRAVAKALVAAAVVVFAVSTPRVGADGATLKLTGSVQGSGVVAARGGAISLTVIVKGARTCRFSSTPTVARFAGSVRCTSGKVVRRGTVPLNRKVARVIHLRVTVFGVHGRLALQAGVRQRGGVSTPTGSANVQPGSTTPPSASPPSVSPTTTSVSPTTTSSGWEVTVYVTPVEMFYGGPSSEVIGCLTVNCGYKNDTNDLGAYATSFVNRVKDEGAGRITVGPHTGMYLNWSAGVSDTGYWLDTAPRDSYGGVLTPFVSAAADGLARGTALRVTACGTNGDGSSANPTVCAKFEQSRWVIRDQFTPGLGGAKHIDLYIGEETQANFESTSPYWVTFENATISS
jgi:hypothetical protein